MSETGEDAILPGLALHLALLSMMAVGGGVAMLAPDIERYAVGSNHFITSTQFADAYTIAQALPGPNLLYVTLMGWWIAGWSGALVATLAIIVPPAGLTLALMRMTHGHKVSRLGSAIRAGLVPVSVGLLCAGSFVLLRGADSSWRLWLLSVATVVLSITSRINPVWLICAGALVGIFGLA